MIVCEKECASMCVNACASVCKCECVSVCIRDPFFSFPKWDQLTEWTSAGAYFVAF